MSEIKDPYKILGVSPTASDDQVKKAYRELAMKYHPDNYANNPLAELANEKMKEINEAYDTVTKQRTGASKNYYSHSEKTTADMSDYMKIRVMINSGEFSEAEATLNSITEHTAEWHYLYAGVLVSKGMYYDASRHFDEACYMDPSNEEYAKTRDNLRRSRASVGNDGDGGVQNDGGNGRRRRRAEHEKSSCDCNDMCEGLCCNSLCCCCPCDDCFDPC